MLQLGPDICSMATCRHPECRQAGRCCGMEYRRLAPVHFQQRAERLQQEALAYGVRLAFTITMGENPLKP